MIMPNILGKEFECINKILSKLPSSGVGDDCAIIQAGSKKLLISTDSFVEGVHFSLKYFSLKEVGYRCAEAAISDLAAMGAKPLYLLLSISSPSTQNIIPISLGIGRSLRSHKIKLIGGDTTKSDSVMLNITVIGESKKPIKRSGAKKGDLVFISSYTGLSCAGLEAINNNIKGFNILKKAHKEPKAKAKEGLTISKIATSMIDISDSLASELHHLAYASKVSIEIDRLPIHKEIKRLSKLNRTNPLKYVLYGGEDYHLLYTTNKKNKKKAIGFCIGRVVGNNSTTKKVWLKKDGRKKLVDPKKGFLHF